MLTFFFSLVNVLELRHGLVYRCGCSLECLFTFSTGEDTALLWMQYMSPQVMSRRFVAILDNLWLKST